MEIFFLHTDCIFQLRVLSLIYARATREPPRDFAQKAKSLRGRVKGADELATAGRLKETIVEIW